MFLVVILFITAVCGPGTTQGANGGRNLALHKPVTSSSQWGSRGGPSTLTDGQVPPHKKWDYNKCLCSRKDSDGPWVRVDLEATSSVSSVEVFNPLYWSWWKRTFPFEVRIGDDPDVRKNPICGQPQTNVVQNELLEISCGGAMKGRYVGIWKKNSRNYLNICEIRAFGPSGETGGNNQENNNHNSNNNGGNTGTSTHTGGADIDLASGRPVVASSRWTGDANKLTDGIKPSYGRWDAKTCYMTRNDYATISVDLGSTSTINKVEIYNSMWGSHWKRTYPFEVRIGNSPNVMDNPRCGPLMEQPYSKPGTDLITISCPGAVGRYVGLKKTNRNYMNICDIKAYGQPGNGGGGGGGSGGGGGGNVECGWSEWTAWSDCIPQSTGSCDGNQRRYKHPVPASCSGLTTDSRNCKTSPLCGGGGGGSGGGAGSWGADGADFPTLMAFCDFQSQSYFWCH